MAKKKQDRSTYGMIDLNKLDKEKQPVMSNILKPTVFASSKIKIELQEGYVSNQFEGVKYSTYNLINF